MRLTERDKNNVAYWCGINGKSSSDIKGNIYGEAITKLADYEDLEEQGLLIKLPIPIGKPIYKVCYASKINDGVIYEGIMSLMFYANNQKAFEKGLIYADKEEAEKKLAEMKGE